MNRVFTIRMRRPSVGSTTLQIGSEVLEFTDGVAKSTNYDTVKEIRHAMSAHLVIQGEEPQQSDEKPKGPKPKGPKPQHNRPPKKRVDPADLPSDEDIPGIAVGELVDGDEAQSKTIVKVPKKTRNKTKPRPKPKPKKTKRR